MDLKDLRNQIDKIDTQILKLLAKRAEVSIQIGMFKAKNNMPIFDLDRENIAKRERILKGKERGLTEEFVLNIFSEIMEYSKHIQSNLAEK